MGIEGVINAATVVASLGGVVGMLLLLRKQARKLQADTRLVGSETTMTDISGAAKLSDTALKLMDAAKAQANEARIDAKTANDRCDELEARVDRYADLARTHMAWDDAVVTQIRLLGGQCEAPPPLIVDREVA